MNTEIEILDLLDRVAALEAVSGGVGTVDVNREDPHWDAPAHGSKPAVEWAVDKSRPFEVLLRPESASDPLPKRLKIRTGLVFVGAYACSQATFAVAAGDVSHSDVTSGFFDTSAAVTGAVDVWLEVSQYHRIWRLRIRQQAVAGTPAWTEGVPYGRRGIHIVPLYSIGWDSTAACLDLMTVFVHHTGHVRLPAPAPGSFDLQGLSTTLNGLSFNVSAGIATMHLFDSLTGPSEDEDREFPQEIVETSASGTLTFTAAATNYVYAQILGVHGTLGAPAVSFAVSTATTPLINSRVTAGDFQYTMLLWRVEVDASGYFTDVQKCWDGAVWDIRMPDGNIVQDPAISYKSVQFGSSSAAPYHKGTLQLFDFENPTPVAAGPVENYNDYILFRSNAGGADNDFQLKYCAVSSLAAATYTYLSGSGGVFENVVDRHDELTDVVSDAAAVDDHDVRYDPRYLYNATFATETRPLNDSSYVYGATVAVYGDTSDNHWNPTEIKALVDTEVILTAPDVTITANPNNLNLVVNNVLKINTITAYDGSFNPNAVTSVTFTRGILTAVS